MSKPQLKTKEQGGDLLFTGEVPPITGKEDFTTEKSKQDPWKVMVVDDDELVHQVTLMVLDGFSFQGRGLTIIQGHSGDDACRLMKEHPDTAALLLDVVMETDTAGLDAVKYIRNELDNRFVRIILRTGQPGQAPEREVITEFDINDYKEKTELTAQRLFTSITAALRAYGDLKLIEELAINNTNLEQRVSERTLEIMKINEELQGEVVERNKAYQKLQESEQRLHEAQHIARIGNWNWDITTGEIIWSDQIYTIIGVNPSTPKGTFNDLLAVVAEDERPTVKAVFEKCRQDGVPYDIEHSVVREDDRLVYVHQQGQVELDKTGQAIRMAGTMQDITQRRQTEAQMRKLSGAVEQIADSVMITNGVGVVEYVNPAFEEMTGYTKEEAIGSTPRLLKSERQSASFYARLWKTVLDGQVFNDVIINRKKNGQFYYEEKTITPQKDQHGNIIHFISTGKDVTERIESQERLHYLAHHDALTGLPNRVLLQDRLAQALSRSRWHERNIAVLFMDVDRFKIINDTLGHAVGDNLLQQMATRLLECIREGDTVSRLGGDEFAVVLNDLASDEDVLPIAEKMISTLKTPMYIDGHELFVTSSIGISMFPRDGTDSNELLKKADVAMYRAKAQGKDKYQLYNADDDVQAVGRLSIENQLRRALEKGEFSLNYQPQLDITDGSIIGFEALLRWYNQDLKNMPPLQFIPILEETGMIIPVGDWVLRTACQQEKAWQNAGMSPHRIAVNLSIRQFQGQGLVRRIDEILSEIGLLPQYLELEITEGLLIEQITETAKVLNELHEMGIHLSIDDFGTGYSSMSYLKRLPFDTLKIDRMFISDITFNPDDAAIATAIISLAHTLGMQVIAEGVETHDQLQYLQQQQCDAMQGYLFSPPLAADAVVALIKHDGGPKLILNEQNEATSD